jgi:hypothetical protein
MSEKLNIPAFYLGQKVVCIQSAESYGLFKDKTYTLTDVRLCSCGETTVSFGVPHGKQTWLCECFGCNGEIKNSLGQWYCRSARFAPLQESQFRVVSFEKVMEETEIICEN